MRRERSRLTGGKEVHEDVSRAQTWAGRSGGGDCTKGRCRGWEGKAERPWVGLPG